MKHTRTLVREHLARELVNRGAWKNSIYVDRATPIEEDDNWPNVCIYTQSERTVESSGNSAWLQELSLLVEVRHRREADMSNAWSRNISGLPNHGAQTADASRLLDDACELIEQLVIQTFHRRVVNVDDEKLQFEPITGINTDITRSADGEIPYVLAQIEFKLMYEKCVDPLPPDTCPLEHIFGEQMFKTCNPADPLNGTASMPSGNYMPESLLSDCR
jgi:hypothetical protein